MTNDRSRTAFFDFLDYLANKGLMAKATVSARKASAGKVLGILSEEEAKDITQIDLEEVMVRFQNLEGKNYTPTSLGTYQSRTKSALEDFEVYLKNPMGFKPSAQKRDRSAKPEAKQNNTRSNSKLLTTTASESGNAITPPGSSILPIQIRQDVTVHIQGLPFDLTEKEAQKIANVIRAMATPA